MMLLFQSVIRAGILARVSSNQGIALAIVRNELEILRAGGYDALPSSGSFSNELLNSLPGSAVATRVVTAYNAQTKQVSVSVEWRDAGSPASSTVSLQTLITETGGI